MDLSGARIGRYEIELLLGQGGMGRVLLARDTVLGRDVAIKLLRDDLGLTPELKVQLALRMRQEARATATLSHPAIVTLFDLGEDERVGLYLVFERIAGPTLRERLHESGPLPPSEVAQLARALGSALTYAHAAGVVHRDVKPENVMLSPVGPKLTDFGIARLPDSTLTNATSILGTPAYSAPEALASGTFGPRSDQFSLATTLYEALTGQRAFQGEDMLVVSTRVATGMHAAPTAVQPSLQGFAHLDAIFDRALAKEDKMRFASCEAFGAMLAAELEGANTAFFPTPVPRFSMGAGRTRRRQNVALLTGLLVIAGLVAVGRLRPGEGRGVSFRDVAKAFAAAAGGSRATSGVGSRRPHAPASAAAISAVSPTTPSGSARPALESATADAGRQLIAPDVRAPDAVAPDSPER